MRDLGGWLLHGVVTVVVLRAVGAFARSVGATAYLGLSVVTAAGVALACVGTAFLLRSTTERTSRLLVRLLPVPLLLAVGTAWQVVGAGAGPGLVALAVGAWVVGAAGGVAATRAVGRVSAQRRQSVDWSVLR